MYGDDGSPRVRLTLLGGFALARGERVAVGLPLGGQRLVAFLAMQVRPVQRSYVSARLWPDDGETQAAARLRSALWRVRRAGVPVLSAGEGYLSLAESVAVDIHEVRAAVARLADPADRQSADMDPTLLTGELLPYWEEDWVAFQRECLRQLCLHGLDAMCARLLEQRRFGAAIEAGLTAVRCEPLREHSHRLIIVAHLAEGNPSEALRQFRWYERLVRQELGILPSTQITDLVHELAEVG